jgi:probable rRNA maturation factor
MAAPLPRPVEIEISIECERWLGAEPALEALVRGAAARALGDRPGALTLLLADDDFVRDLNRRYRGIDKATNVLSFPALQAFPGRLGDIVLAFETVASEARAQGKLLRDHARHLVVHGVLHLLGRDHEVEAEAEAMEALERSILAELGVADPYLARD